ncbi:MAG TPA: hypothetical protein VK131_07830 [Candidatus Acidoferrales bacterium]|nr:hypothetical protein [Candidatus Acidoferrales bacterium]
MARYLANVGVNAAHAARSPLFPDGSFRVLPIPERQPWAPPMLRLRDLPNLTPHAPRSWLDRAVHLDPDLDSAVRTYGDNCRRAGRAFSLRRARPGDLIVFLARLQDAFHTVGEFEIAEVLSDVTKDPGPGWWDANAHVRRARASGAWDSFWVFRGSERSGWYPSARPFGREQADRLFEIVWRPNRSEQQTIGSYTRAVRRLA